MTDEQTNELIRALNRIADAMEHHGQSIFMGCELIAKPLSHITDIVADDTFLVSTVDDGLRAIANELTKNPWTKGASRFLDLLIFYTESTSDERKNKRTFRRQL